MTVEPIPLTDTQKLTEEEAAILRDKAYNQAIGLLIKEKENGYNFLLHIADGSPTSSVGLSCCSEEFFADAMIQMYNDLHENYPIAREMIATYLASKCDCPNCKKQREEHKKHVN